MMKQEDSGKKIDVIDRGKRLILLRSMALLSRQEFADLAEIPFYTLKTYELGLNYGLPESRASELLKIFSDLGIQCSLGWLMHGAGSLPSLIDPAYQLVAYKSSKSKTEADVPRIEMEEELQYFKKIHPDSALMVVQDDAMEPNYFKGDLVAGERRYKNFGALINLPCVIETMQGNIYFRKLSKGSESGLFSLRSLNTNTSAPFLIENQELYYAAPVIWHRKKDIYPH